MKSSGPKTDPWGTPDEQTLVEEERLPSLTNWQRFVRYEDIQFKTVPEMPKVVLRRLRRRAWSMVSKVELRSS